MTMATLIKYEAKALLLFLALISYGAEVLGGRRGLAVAGGNTGGATVFNVNDYGAKADGKTDNVQAFMKAWNAACHSKEPAKLFIPKGTYMAGQVAFGGPCTSPAPITVEVQGNLIANPDLSEYPSPEWFSFESVDGLIVTGGGTFDGKGAEVWKYNDCQHNYNCQLLPNSLKFSKVTNAIVEDIKSINSKSFHYSVFSGQNITFQNLHINAPGDSPNTDGIHISQSNLITITNSVIGTGDDCISIGAGTTNLIISNILCGPGHGISVGSLGKYKNEGDVKGITVTNCTLTNTTNGARIKTWPGSPPSSASSITFQDITMDGVKNPIIIDQNYGSSKAQPSQVKISDVHFKNIKGTTGSVLAVDLTCSKSAPCEGVQLSDINLSFNGSPNKQSLFSSECLNAKVTYGGKLNPPPCK